MGLFIAALLLHLFLSIVLFDVRSWMFWFFAIMALLYALAIYCWIDEDRYQKFEYYLTPVFYGLFFMLIVSIFAGALVSFIKGFISGEYGWGYLPVALIALASIGTLAYFDFRLFLQPYFTKKSDKTKEDD